MELIQNLAVFSACVGILTGNPIFEAIPFALRIISMAFPSAYPEGTSRGFTTEQNEKFARIQGIVRRVAADLGIENPERVQLRVFAGVKSQASIVGMTSSFGGPVLVLGKKCFDAFESAEEEGSARFTRYQESIDALPDDPQELAERIDTMVEQLREQAFSEEGPVDKNLLRLAFYKRKIDVLSEAELESVIARELGHAKHHHMLTYSGWMEIGLRVNDLAFTVFSMAGFGLIYMFASLPLIFAANAYIQRKENAQADRECQGKYKRGWVRLQKRRLLQQLDFIESNNSKKVTRLLKANPWFGSQVNAAQRLFHATKLSDDENIAPTQMSLLAKVVAAVGVLSIFGRAFHLGSKIVEYLTFKEIVEL